MFHASNNTSVKKMSLLGSLLILSVLSVLTFLQPSQAVPDCSINALMPCITPLLVFGQSQEAVQIAALQRTGRDIEITENQLNKICKTVQSLTTCVAEYTQRCVEQDIEDLHNIIEGSVKLLEVCDKPNMYANAKVLMSCNKALNATDSTYQGCIYKSNKSIKSLQEKYIARDPSIALQMMRTGTVLRDICCALKDLNACLSPKYQTCSVQAADLNSQVYDAIFAAYGCQQKVANGCPAQS